MKRVIQWLSLAGLASAQSAVSSNTTTYDPSGYSSSSSAPVKILLPDNSPVYGAVPLTPEAYDDLPHARNSDTSINGTAVLNTPGTDVSVSNISSTDIAYTSCEEADYPGQLTMSDVIQRAIDANATAIIFYSLNSRFCNLNSDLDTFGGYTSLYSLESVRDPSQTPANSAANFLDKLVNNMVSGETNIFSRVALGNRGGQHTASLGDLGSGGTTAVAMIILYSITGVITALFLIIIVTGAIRAHRHPERYGPRNLIGRPRQSRAKGIGRAMLDTLPILKFGDHNKDGNKDVEDPLRDGTNGTEMRAPGAGTEAVEGTDSSTPGLTSGVAAGTAPTTESTESPNSSAAAAAATTTSTTSQPEEAEGCSICTEDFERGEDIRVLPCNHHFHPACVDPWLLDVSGTCPLCRVDLNPQGSDETTVDGLPPPLDPQGAAHNVSARRRSMLRAVIMRSSTGPDPAASGLNEASQEARLRYVRRLRDMTRQRNTSSTTTPSSEQQAVVSGTTDGAQDAPQDDDRRRSRLGALSRLMRRR